MANIDTPIWAIEGVALESVDPAVAGSLADVALSIQTGVAGLDTSDLSDILEEVEEIETHIHSRGYWYGKDPGDALFLVNGLVSWQLQAGVSGAYGSWVQLSDGTEVTAGNYYDPHLLMVTAASAAGKLYYIQLGTGESGAQVVSGMSAFFPAATLRQSPVVVQHARIAATSKLWARCNSETDSATINIVVGLHVYP